MKSFLGLKTLGGYSVGRKLGSGKYSTVRLATKDGKTYAMKIIKKDLLKSDDDWKRIRRETEILTTLDHPNIINLHEVFETENAMCIVTDYADGGDLFDFILQQPYKRVHPKDAFPLFRQMLSAISYCHHRYVIHRDLKPENVFLMSDMKVKIGDFGFARTFAPENPMSTPCGSFAYAAPEVITGKKYLGGASDAWSLGCILYVMLTGGLPFKGANNVETMQRVREGKFIQSEFLINDETIGFFKEIFNPNPKKRLTVAEMAKHKVVWQDRPLLRLLVKPFANMVKDFKQEVKHEKNPLRKSFSESELRISSGSVNTKTYTKPTIQISTPDQTKLEDADEDSVAKDLGIKPKSRHARSNSSCRESPKRPLDMLLKANKKNIDD